MQKWDVAESCSIYNLLGGFYNAYLLIDHQEFFLIDTGREKKFPFLEQNLKKIIDGPIQYLILTHTHYDHCENAASIKENWGAKIIVSNKEAGYLKKGSTPLPKGTNLFTYVLSNLGNRYATSWYLYKPVIPDVEINGLYSINESIKIISTPGHSKGSLTVVIKDQYAIVGDALFGSPMGSILPHFADEKNRLFDTWKQLLNSTNCHTFLPGHGKPISRHRLEKEVAKIK
jgi:hydroxyacylglutathione hydrolase